MQTMNAMRALTLLAALPLVACGGGSATPDEPVETLEIEVTGPAWTSTPSEITEDGLINGGVEAFTVADVDVLLKHTPGNPTVYVGVWFDGGVLGWDDTTAGHVDLALAAMADGGPASMEKTAYTAAMDAVGASISGSAGYDRSSVGLSCVRPVFDDVWPVFAATLSDPAFRAEDFALLQERVVTSRTTELDEPDNALGILLKERFFAEHPYSRRPDGDAEAVAAATVEDLRTAWTELRQRERMLIVVVGDLTREDIETRIAELVVEWPMGVPLEVTVPTLPPMESDVHVDPRPELPTNYILGYFPMPHMGDEDYAAAEIAMRWLRMQLFEEVRTRRNLTYAVSSGMATRRANTGYLYVTATDPNTTVQVMYDTVDAVIAEPPTEAELASEVETYLTSLYMGLQSNASQAGLLARWELGGMGRLNADAHLRALEAVTPEDVAAVLDRWVRDVRWVVVGDPDQIDEELFTSR